MNKDDKLKFLFVAVVLALALIGRGDKDNSQKTAIQENIKDTSLAAVARPQFSEAKTDKTTDWNNGSQLNDSSVPDFFDNLIYRKDWNLPEPDLKVKAALVKNLNSNFDFYSLNSNERWPLASLTKLMAAIIAIEEVGENKIVTISKSAVESEGPAGNLETGEQYLVADLLKAMLVVSSNDAAEAIAEFYGRQDFIRAMQKKAEALGMQQTDFADPTGLSFLNQSTTADLEKLVQYIYAKHLEIFELTRQEKVFTSELTKNIKKELININNFAARPDFFGGKTGFTDEADGNLISLFDYQERKILIIVFGTDDRFGQTEILYNWIKGAFEFN